MDDLYEEEPLKTEPSEKRKRDLEDLEFLLNDEHGQRFLSRLIHEICGFNRSSFTGNSRTFFNEGERNVGLRVFSDIVEINPKHYTRLLTENSNERRTSSAN